MREGETNTSRVAAGKEATLPAIAGGLRDIGIR